jgi:protein CpxP
MNKVLRLVSAGVAVAVLSVGTAFAQDPAPEQPGFHGKRHMRGFKGHGGMGMRFSEALGLTEAQKQQIEEIRKADGDRMREMHQTLAEKRRALEDALATYPVNRATVDALVTEIGTAQTEMMRHQTELRIKMLDILTPEQRQKMTEMRGERGNRGGKLRMRRGATL